MTGRFPLAVSVVSLNAALLSSASAATCVTDVTATTGNVVNSVTGQTGAAVTAVNPTFGNALTGVQTTATQGSFLTGATLATTSGNAVTNVSATTTPVGVVNNATTVNTVATIPPGVFSQQGRVGRRVRLQPSGHSKRAGRQRHPDDAECRHGSKPDYSAIFDWSDPQHYRRECTYRRHNDFDQCSIRQRSSGSDRELFDERGDGYHPCRQRGGCRQ